MTARVRATWPWALALMLAGTASPVFAADVLGGPLPPLLGSPAFVISFSAATIMQSYMSSIALSLKGLPGFDQLLIFELLLAQQRLQAAQANINALLKQPPKSLNPKALTALGIQINQAAAAIGQIVKGGLAATSAQSKAEAQKLAAQASQLAAQIEALSKQTTADISKIQDMMKINQDLINNILKMQKTMTPSMPLFGAFATTLADHPAFAAMAYATMTPDADLPAGLRWTLWSNASYTHTGFGGAAPTSGWSGLVNGGVGYRLLPLVTVGLSAGAEQNRFDTQYNGGHVNSSGTTLAPYASFDLTPNVMLNVAGGATFLQTDFSDGLRTANYNGTRYFGAASLIGTWYSGALRLSPSANLLAGQVRSDAYTASDGSFLPAQIVHFGRISGGSEFGYAMAQEYGTIEPFVFAFLEHDFGDTASVIAANGTIFAPGTTGVKAGGGLKVSLFNGWYGAASASYDSLFRQDTNTWSATASLRLAF